MRIQNLAVLVIVVTLLFSSMAGAEGKKVLFDQAHGQRFIVEHGGPLDLSGFAEVFIQQGFAVDSSIVNLSAAILNGVEVLIVSGPFVPLSARELQLVKEFVAGGGSLCVMLHIAPSALDLLDIFGVNATMGVVNEKTSVINNNPLDFQVKDLKLHPVTKDLAHFNAYGVWSVESFIDEQGKTIAYSSSSAWLDRNRNRQEDAEEISRAYGIAVAGTFGKGKFAVFGDDAIFQNRFLGAENRKLTENLVRWLGARDANTD